MTADLFAEALAAHMAGNLAEAERLYRATIEAEPRRAQARTNLATVWLQLGRLEDGAEGIRQSLAIDPAQPAALNNLGLALRGLGRTEQALDVFRSAIALNPGAPDTLVNYATLLDASGQLEAAAEAYAAAAAVHAQPGPLRHAQGLTLYRLGRPEEAVAPLRQAVDLAPGTPEFLNDLGVALDETGHMDEALGVFAKALALRPDYPEAANNQALVLFRLDRLPEALAGYDRALQLKPDYPKAWVNRADVLCAQGLFEQALACVDRALAVDPADADAWSRRGDMLGYLRRLDEAEAAYARALDLDPGHASASFHLAFPLLREGRYAEGLPIYENRWRGSLKTAKVELPRPLWLGETAVKGKTLLLHSEQGHGDTLMMMRYAPLLARQGATVILSVQAPVETLAAAVEGVSAVIAQETPLPPYDLHIPMMSLPLAFGTRVETVPGEPHLRAPEAERARWAQRLGAPSRPRIGLVWSGSPAQKDNRWRSLPLAALAPLFELDADLFALQTEMTATDRVTLASAPIRDLSADLATYADTAAVMEQMDLVITVCTSAANLAGGLGRPTLVMLGAVADWRWGLDPDSSPWFPAARLFRQAKIGAWDEVVARVKAAAEATIKTPGGRAG